MTQDHRIRTALLVFLLASACGQQTRYFRMLVSSNGATPGSGQVPDSCYRDSSVPNPTTPEQQMAQGFCQVPTKPTQSGGTTTESLFLSESWSLVDLSADEAYLVRNQSAGSSSSAYRIGYGGKRTARGYEFSAGSTSWIDSCTSGGSTCATPTRLSRASTATITMELNKAEVRGVLSQGTDYLCENGGCASDFAERCPACAVATNIVGVETTDSVQETEIR